MISASILGGLLGYCIGDLTRKRGWSVWLVMPAAIVLNIPLVFLCLTLGLP